jgi:hypothetical protein
MAGTYHVKYINSNNAGKHRCFDKGIGEIKLYIVQI